MTLSGLGCSGEVGSGPSSSEGATLGPQGGTAANGATPQTNADGTAAGTAVDATGATVAAGGVSDASSATAATTTTAATGDTASTAGTADGTGQVTDSTLTDGVDGAASDGVAQACVDPGVLNAGISKMRRLTRTQLDNTLRDLLGIQSQPSSALVPDERIGPFYSNTISPVTDLIVQQHQEIAARIAVEVEPRMAEIAPCDLNAGGACVGQFIEEFGLRAFRRPLTAVEVEGLTQLFTLGQSSGGASNGFRLVVEAMLQAPSFVYLADVGISGVPSALPEAIDPYALASRLSYFLWDSMPDEELFALAGQGMLNQDDVLNLQVERMLQDPRAESTISSFHYQLLGLEKLTTAEKDADVFPQYSPDLVTAMLDETTQFTQEVVLRGDGLLSTLLASNVAYPSGGLFDVYGVQQPAGFAPGTPVDLDPTERAGLLTQAAFLTSHAKRNATSPVHRGIIVRENLMCQTIPPPPADVVAVLPPASPATTTRERFAIHLESPACAGCHQLMDPIGLGFENYDGIGSYRTMEGDVPVDATGEVTQGGADLAGMFNNGTELAIKLSQSEVVRDCVATQWFRFSLGRVESQDDACSIKSIQDGFGASAGNVRGLLSQIVLTDAFRHVRSTASQETL